MSLPNVTINGNALSDLFFSAEHEAYDALYAQAQTIAITAEAKAAAITKDAVDFVEKYLPHPSESGITPDHLAQDFLKRE